MPSEHAAGIAGTQVGAQPFGNTSSSAFLVRNVFAAGDKRSVSRAWNHRFGLGNSRPGCNCSLACVCGGTPTCAVLLAHLLACNNRVCSASCSMLMTGGVLMTPFNEIAPLCLLYVSRVPRCACEECQVALATNCCQRNSTSRACGRDGED